MNKYASVVSVEPAFETNRVPREVCGDQTTLEQAPVKDEKRMQEGNLEEKTQEHCVTVYDTESVQADYDVTYELDGVQTVVRMDRDPG